MNSTKNRHLVMCLATMAYVTSSCAVCVTILVPVVNSDRLNFMELHVLTQATCSYVLIVECVT